MYANFSTYGFWKLINWERKGQL